MKLTIHGKVGKQEILESIANALNTLEEAGVQEYSGLNLYFNAYSSGLKVVPKVKGKEFDIYLRSTGTHVKHSKDDDGSVNLIYKKVKTEEINLSGAIPLNSKIEIPTQRSINDELKRQALAREENQRMLQQERNAKLRSESEIKKQDKRIANSCCKKLQDKLNLSVDDFLNQRSSMGWIIQERSIKKYSEEIEEKKVFRVSMKTQEKDAKHIFLFSAQEHLIYEGLH